MTDNPKIKWVSPKRILGKTLFEMLPTPTEMLQEFVKHELIPEMSGSYHKDVYDMCRNGATWLGAQLANLLGEDVQIVEGTFLGMSHCWVVIEDYYFDMTIAQVDESYPEFAVVQAKNAKGYSEFMRFSVAKWIQNNTK